MTAQREYDVLDASEARDPFYDVAARAIESYRADRRRREIQGSSYGPWGIWQHDKINRDEPLPRKHYDRFNLFLKEMAAPIGFGEQHMHLYYDRSRRQSYWSPAAPSRVCKVEGRCKKVIIQDPDDLFRH